MTLAAFDAIDTGTRVRQDMGDLHALADSIDAVGLLHPIVVMGHPDAGARPWLLVAGERRLRACRDILGWVQIQIRVVPMSTDLLRAEHDENAVREPFTPSEAVDMARLLRPEVEAAAAQREQAGEPSSETDKGRTDDVLARAVGMGRTKLRQATTVVEAAEQAPVLAPLVEAMDATGNVAGTHAALQALPPDPTPVEVEAAAATVAKPSDAEAYAARERALTPEMREAEALAAARIRWSKGLVALHRALDQLGSPDVVLPRMESGERVSTRSSIEAVRAWADRSEKAMGAGLRAIAGGRS